MTDKPLPPDDSDDFESFQDLTADIKPLNQDKVTIAKSEPLSASSHIRRAAAQNKQTADANFLTDADIPLVDPNDILSFKVDGLQTGVFKKLRLGKYSWKYRSMNDGYLIINYGSNWNWNAQYRI